MPSFKRLRILTIVGARPQFVKAAALSRELRKNHEEILVHTGQHYSNEMSDIFFKELEIPRPDFNLEVGSGSHAVQTGQILVKTERVMKETSPDAVLVYGDTNSTLAGALAAAKLNIPVIHVEAGLRSFNQLMPEELNRVAVDHLSSILLCPNHLSQKQLAKEGLLRGVFVVGDLMADVLQFGLDKISKAATPQTKSQGKYCLATIHRAENTNDVQKFSNLLLALSELGVEVILPLHPRTKKVLDENKIKVAPHIKIIPPVGYLEMLTLQQNAEAIFTDSGGVQKEAYWLKIPCFTLRDQTEWMETVESGWNALVGTDPQKIISCFKNFKLPNVHPELYGDGHAARACLAAIEKSL